MPAGQLAQYASAVGVQPTRRVPGAQATVELHALQVPLMTLATASVDQVEPATQASQKVSAVALHTERVPAAHVLAAQLVQADALVAVEKVEPGTHATQAASAVVVQPLRYEPARQVGGSAQFWQAADGGMTSAFAAEDHVEPAEQVSQPTSAVREHAVATEPAEHGLVERQGVQPLVLAPVPLTEKEPSAQSVQYESAEAVQATPYWPGVVQSSVVQEGQMLSLVPLTEKVPEVQGTHAVSCAPPHTCLKVPGVAVHEKVTGSVQAVQVPLLLCATAVVDQVPAAQVAQEVSAVVVQATV